MAIILAERKSKYKHKVVLSSEWGGPDHREIQAWCEQTFGPGGRRERWRFGWTDKNDTYYFKSGEDASMFVLRWS